MLETNLSPEDQLASDANRIVAQEFADRLAARKARWSIEEDDWADALNGIDPSERCPSTHPQWKFGCAMRAGHKTGYHRNCEVSWKDPVPFPDGLLDKGGPW